MDEFFVVGQPEGVHLLLDDVFDGLDIVVGHRFDFLDAFGVGRREIEVERAQGCELRAVDARQLRQGQLAQRNEVLHFHTDAVADQGLFRKIIGQFFRFVAVAPSTGEMAVRAFSISGMVLFVPASNLRQ